MMNQFMLILLLLMIFWMSFIEAMIHKHHRAPVLSGNFTKKILNCSLLSHIYYLTLLFFKAVKQTMDQGYVTCGLQLIETVPKILEKKKIKSKHKTIFDAWLELIGKEIAHPNFIHTEESSHSVENVTNEISKSHYESLKILTFCGFD